jgi:FixJ family two-component response regulator
VKSPLVAIVDDDVAVCSSMVDLMRSAGYRAESFTSGTALLRSSNLWLFDCIVADVHMPEMSGLDLIRKLRREGAKTPTILITGNPDQQLEHEAISVGAQCLLRKPLETKTLFDHVESTLSDEYSSR